MSMNRRFFLKGLSGVTFGLPLLESLVGTKAMAATRVGNAIFVRAGNGVVQASSEGPDRFWPRTTGALTTAILATDNADRATSELAAYASKLVLLKNVQAKFPRNSCGHAESLPQILTAADHTPGSSNTPLALGRSVDHLIAEQLNPANQGPLAFMAGPTNTYIGEGLSWSAPRMRTPAERSPLNTYMRLSGVMGAPPAVQLQVAQRRKSVNDLVRSQLSALQSSPQLSAADKARLKLHAESVRDMEVRMTCDLEPTTVTAVRAIPTSQVEGNDVRPEVVKRFMDLAAWAFNCGLNHAATLQVGEGNDQTEYTIGGTKLPRFHWISHRIYSDGSDGQPIANAIDLHHSVDRFQLQMFKYLLDRLSAYPSAYGGTLLDDSVAVWINDLGTGPAHSADNLPWILAGSAGGAIKTGQTIDHQKKTNNLVLNSIASAVGVRKAGGALVDDFGDASLARGQVQGLLNIS
jgi:hypothetical protein